MVVVVSCLGSHFDEMNHVCGFGISVFFLKKEKFSKNFKLVAKIH